LLILLGAHPILHVSRIEVNIFLNCNPISTDNSTTKIKICGWHIYFEFVHISASLAILRETTLDTAGNQGFIFSYVK
jgi:hypothetical protein